MEIKNLLKEKGLTQKAFAEKLGMTNVGLNQLINGKPSYPTLEKFAEALEVPIWRLFVSPDDITPQDDFASYIRYKGIHYTADTPEEFFKQVDEIKAIVG